MQPEHQSLSQSEIYFWTIFNESIDLMKTCQMRKFNICLHLRHFKSSPSERSTRTVYARNIYWIFQRSHIIIFLCYLKCVILAVCACSCPVGDHIWDPLFRIKAEALLFGMEFFYSVGSFFMLFWIESDVAMAMIIC